MQALGEVFVKILLLLGFGFVLRKRDVITDSLQSGLADLLIKAVLPMRIINSAAVEIEGAMKGQVLHAFVIAVGYYLLTILLTKGLSKKVPLSKGGKDVFIAMVVFANTGFVGIPLLYEVFGAEGMLYAAIYNLCFQLFFFTYGVGLLSREKKIDWKLLYKNPVTIASLISLVIFFSPLQMPDLFTNAIGAIGGMTTPISMLLIGCMLSQIRMKEILTDAMSYPVSLLRLLILPLLLLGIFYFSGKTGLVYSSCVLMTALPSGSLNAIYAEQTQGKKEAAYATGTVIQSMLFMPVTLPVVLYLCEILLKG